MAYWPILRIGGSAVDLSHIEPFHLAVEVEKLRRKVMIDVKFSNHCFTEKFDATRHDPAHKIMDHKAERAFDQHRFALSKRLPNMVRNLPQTSVWQTPAERNYVYFVVLDDGAGKDYLMFFHLKKHRGDADLSMFIESAYAAEARTIVGRAHKVRFPILCAKVVQGESLTFRTRR